MRASARDLLLQQGYSSPNQGPSSIDAFEASLRMGGTSSYISSTEEEEGMEYRNGSGNGRSVWSMEWGEGPLCQTQTTTTEPPNLTRHRRLSRVVPDVEPTRKDSSAAVGGSVAHFVGGRTLGGEEALTCPTERRRKRVGAGGSAKVECISALQLFLRTPPSIDMPDRAPYPRQSLLLPSRWR
ncbi:hypothetical protein B296_00022114 [Ensete ventricosum]|uniref:Uncharacterized protein n=1 Tax=Ensete ventricosum TaxID=4639 RepID=A0A426YNY6_ENSVE|nr:hypothetical protein B296_00022114 [Ensete ventricosum]